MANGRTRQMDLALGVDVGSVTTKIVALDPADEVVASCYIRTGGDPIGSIQEAVARVRDELPKEAKVTAAGSTGSARELAGVMIGADLTRNEITCHAVAATMARPDTRTVIEIGGQDSKIIILRGGIAVDFAMNTVCAAGTGSFLDHQAARLGLKVEEFGEYALRAETPVRIAGRCTVFAESDMVHKQQMGHTAESIVAGLCRALVRNYLNNVGKGKEILPPVVFQGGVAANRGIRAAFEEELGIPIIVPEHHKIMGAIGAGILAREEMEQRTRATSVEPRLSRPKGDMRRSTFKGFEVSEIPHEGRSFDCDRCANNCEIVELVRLVPHGQDKGKGAGEVIARWGSRCGRWSLEAGERGEVGAAAVEA